MAFVITLLYGAALFGAGLWFVRRGRRTPGQNTDVRESQEAGAQYDRRSGGDRRRQPAALSHTP